MSGYFEENILENLNDSQREAVTSTEGYIRLWLIRWKYCTMKKNRRKANKRKGFQTRGKQELNIIIVVKSLIQI